MTQPLDAWVMDPDDPRAPPKEVWDAMSEAQRQTVVDQLPSDFPVSESHPPEGDRHWNTLADARQTLTRWFRKGGRRIYVSGNLPVYYPGERMFSPDVIAVLDVEPHERESWIVSKEGDRGLDFALEIIVSGRRRKDLQDNVLRYADLHIGEYFVVDLPRQYLVAYRLADQSSRSYDRVMPQAGKYPSAVLGIDLYLHQGRLTFSANDADLPNPERLIQKLEQLTTEGEQRYLQLEARLMEEQHKREQEQHKREQEQHKREQEQHKREQAEAEVARLRALLDERNRR